MKFLFILFFLLTISSTSCIGLGKHPSESETSNIITITRKTPNEIINLMKSWMLSTRDTIKSIKEFKDSTSDFKMVLGSDTLSHIHVITIRTNGSIEIPISASKNQIVADETVYNFYQIGSEYKAIVLRFVEANKDESGYFNLPYRVTPEGMPRFDTPKALEQLQKLLGDFAQYTRTH